MRRSARSAVPALLLGATLLSSPSGLLLPSAPSLLPASPPRDAFLLGLDAAALPDLSGLGVTPDLAMVWAGAWILRDGPSALDHDLARLQAARVTPVVQFYHWGDDLSPACFGSGCFSEAHGVWKDRAGWRLLADLVAERLAEHLAGAPAYIVLETEFNKGGMAAHEPFDAALAEMTERLRAGYPAARVVLGFGTWAHEDWGAFDRAAAAADAIGVQGLRGSTRGTLEEYRALDEALYLGAKEAEGRFGKTILLDDVGLSSFPEPAFRREQEHALARILSRIPEFSRAGVEGLVYRGLRDVPTMDPANHFGEAERHWGLADADGAPKPALGAFLQAMVAHQGTAPT
ncbi:MAG: hypothetical protein ACT4PT_14025 [Methanobacteriota archaeon]